MLRLRIFFSTASIIFIILMFVTSDLFFYNAHAQIGPSSESIQIHAQIIGCGDGVSQPFTGEQCDGLDLSNETCRSLGYQSGSLSCRASCIFNVDLCSGTVSTTSRKSSSRSIVREGIPNTNLVFSGTANPGDIVVISRDGEYFISGVVSQDGSFDITVSNLDPDEYNFTFYTISPSGVVSDTLSYTINLQSGLTTQIKNIDFSYDTSVDKKSTGNNGNSNLEKDSSRKMVNKMCIPVPLNQCISDDFSVETTKTPLFTINEYRLFLLSILMLLLVKYFVY